MPTPALPVYAYVPHRGAMCLISRVLEVDDDHAVAEVDVPFDGLFVNDDGMPAWVGLEYMAQTVAAWSGARAQRSGGMPRVGLLLGTRRYVTQRPTFPRGATLRVEVHNELFGDNGLGQFDCRICLNGEELATAMVTVYEPDDVDTLLQGNAS